MLSNDPRTLDSGPSTGDISAPSPPSIITLEKLSSSRKTWPVILRSMTWHNSCSNMSLLQACLPPFTREIHATSAFYLQRSCQVYGSIDLPDNYAFEALSMQSCIAKQIPKFTFEALVLQVPGGHFLIFSSSYPAQIPHLATGTDLNKK